MHEVVVYRIDLDGHLSEAVDQLPLLDPTEKQRSRAFRYEEEGRRFIVAHAARRRILGELVGEAPEALVFGERELGKPYLPRHPDVSFNYSQAGSDGFLAVSTNYEVGIDLERDDGRFEYRSIERNICSPSEQQELLALQISETERRGLFFRLWTRKEALLKSSGHGLYRTPDKVTVWRDGRFLATARTPDGREAALVEVDVVGSHYAGALALIGAQPEVRYVDWD